MNKQNADGASRQTGISDPPAPVPENMSPNIVSSGVFVIIGLLTVIGSAYMPTVEVTADPRKWYSVPGLFPGIIGCCMIILALVMLAKSYFHNRAHGMGFDFACIKLRGGNRSEAVRFLCAASFLVIYIFLLGRANFTALTFFFLAVSMFAFRTGGFAPWKILLVSALVSIAVTYGFGTLARIPLP